MLLRRPWAAGPPNKTAPGGKTIRLHADRLPPRTFPPCRNHTCNRRAIAPKRLTEPNQCVRFAPGLATKTRRSSFLRTFFPARRTGLEPAASGVTGRRYNQLNYRRSAGDFYHKQAPAQQRSDVIFAYLDAERPAVAPIYRPDKDLLPRAQGQRVGSRLTTAPRSGHKHHGNRPLTRDSPIVRAAGTGPRQRLLSLWAITLPFPGVIGERGAVGPAAIFRSDGDRRRPTPYNGLRNEAQCRSPALERGRSGPTAGSRASRRRVRRTHLR